jgi:hypothetical protein
MRNSGLEEQNEFGAVAWWCVVCEISIPVRIFSIMDVVGCEVCWVTWMTWPSKACIVNAMGIDSLFLRTVHITN